LKDVDNSGKCFCGHDSCTPLRRLNVRSEDQWLTMTLDGGFFVFGDLSVKIEGEFRLKFTLFEMRK
jgi:hypothetical protein